MPHIPESVLSRYAVSPQSGFLPNESPIEKLGDGYYSPWETIVVDLPGYIQSGTVRSAIESLPILSTSKLQGEPEWRRAYLVLAFFTHAYVWGGQKPIDVSCIHPFQASITNVCIRDCPPASRVHLSKSHLI